MASKHRRGIYSRSDSATSHDLIQTYVGRKEARPLGVDRIAQVQYRVGGDGKVLKAQVVAVIIGRIGSAKKNLFKKNSFHC